MRRARRIIPREGHLDVLGADYGETKTDRAGRAWGLARTRRPAAPLVDVGALVDHELEQARRAVTVLRATVEELGLRDADPAAAARRFRDQRGAR